MLLGGSLPTFYASIVLHPQQKRCHIVVLPLTLKKNLRQKKNYENSHISWCKNIV
jgi:hypothetical protein